jgi:hypothetical protein
MKARRQPQLEIPDLKVRVVLSEMDDPFLIAAMSQLHRLDATPQCVHRNTAETCEPAIEASQRPS